MFARDSLSLSLSLLFVVTTLSAQTIKHVECDDATGTFETPLPATLCQQNAGFVADIEIFHPTGSGIPDPAGITYVSQLNVPSHPAFGQAWSGKKILIYGTLVLDETTGFENCTVKMAANASIVTFGTSKIYAYGSSFFSCPAMWKGISIKNPGGSAKIVNSKFEDAENTFTIDDGLDCFFSNNVFNRNNIGIRSGDAVSGQAGLIFTGFTKNTFDCDSPLNSNSFYGSFSYAGIYLNNTTASISGGLNVSNTFKRLQYGIFAEGSDVIVVMNKFENMVEENSLPLQNGGVGIYADGGSLLVREKYVSPAGIVSGKPNFKNCIDTGVETNGTDFEIRNSIMLGNYDFGILSQNNSTELVNIHNNLLNMDEVSSDINLGIALDRSNLSGAVAHNTINRNTINMNGATYQKQGIFVSGGDYAIDRMDITNNTIIANTSTQFLRGVEIVSNADCEISPPARFQP